MSDDPNAVVPVNNLPPDYLNQLAADAGLGLSFKTEDQLWPLIYVLQGLSEIVDKRSAAYIVGAEPGHFWLKGAVNPIRDGKVGMDVIHCGMREAFLEWRPGRGGFVARHEQEPGDLKTQISKEGGREKEIKVRASNGNVIEDHREIYLLIDRSPFVLSCHSTQHTFAKTWNGYLRQLKDPRTGLELPSFAHHYRLRTIPTSNALGNWFGLVQDDLGWVASRADYDKARALALIVAGGGQRVEAPFDSSTTAAPSADTDETSARQPPGETSDRQPPGVAPAA